MHDILSHIERWRSEGKAVALATVVKAYGSSPRPLGAKMAVSATGEMAGSVSGGCVEGAVLQEALHVIASGPPKLLGYGIADEWAQTVGLACGGSIEVFVERLGPLFESIQHAIEDDQFFAAITVLAEPTLGRQMLLWADGRSEGDLGTDALNAAARGIALDLLVRQTSERRQIEVAGEISDLFIEVFAPAPRLIIVGAVHLAIPLITFARALGFHTTVIDARSAFATPERFAQADQLILGWPDDILPTLNLNEGSYVAVLSHDDKLDVPALAAALASPARYIGALGARQTMARRATQLREMGITEVQLTRIHNPIGLDLGGRRAEEMALAIMAEIVAVRNGRR